MKYTLTYTYTCMYCTIVFDGVNSMKFFNLILVKCLQQPHGLEARHAKKLEKTDLGMRNLKY